MTGHAQDDAGQTAAPVDYEALRFPYRRSADQDAASDGAPVRHPVVVVGAGPVGLTLAIDLAQQGVPVVVLNDDGRLSAGSRALCFAKRSLEIFDRLGCGDRLVDKGVSWHIGRVFFREQQVYQFDLLPEPGHERPAFINLQQYFVEGFLVERAAQLPLLDLRWHHALAGVVPHGSGVRLTVRTPEGDYPLLADHVVACDGARSPTRSMLGLDAPGHRFKDRFLIADVRMSAPFPAERWFWFDPPFHPGRSVLLHRQPEGVWRIDFQLGWDADPELEKRPENILPRVRALMAQASRAAGGQGPMPEIELVWASVYTFSCSRMERFRHGRVIFAGDAAHGVSPFGARGANSGIQDADNLAWKLAWVVQGRAPERLLDGYAREREQAADENIRHSSRATDFISPRSEVSHLFRDAVLDLSRDHAFARRLVNSGRLSTPTVLAASALSADDSVPDGAAAAPILGAPLPDAPLANDGQPAWALRQTRSGRFSVVMFDDGHDAGGEGAGGLGDDVGRMAALLARAFEGLPAPEVLVVAQTPGRAGALARRFAGVATAPQIHVLHDVQGLARQRWGGRPGTVVLLRPDQHVCARWPALDAERLRSAVRRALDLA